MTPTTQLTVIDRPLTWTLAPADDQPEPHDTPPPSLDFRALYATTWGHTTKDDWQLRWQIAEDAWIATFPSPHTRRNYTHALHDWRAYLWNRYAIRHLWLASSQHAAAWLTHLLTVGVSLPDTTPTPLAPVTANNRIAAVSSFYTYITAHTIIIDGVELSLFIDAAGRRRANPFHTGNIQRPKVIPYGNSNPIHYTVMTEILDYLEHNARPTLATLRDYALLYSFYRTGWRAEEVLDMTWGHLHPNHDATAVTFDWQGKGGKRGKRALPITVWHAILAYLTADGRYGPNAPHPITPHDYIWRPTITSAVKNLGVELDDPNRHITQSSANEILRRHLINHYKRTLIASGHKDRAENRRIARTKAAAYHLHSLRHSFAHQLYEATGDYFRVNKALNHASMQTTKTYLDSMVEPIDDYSAILTAKFGR